MPQQMNKISINSFSFLCMNFTQTYCSTQGTILLLAFTLILHKHFVICLCLNGRDFFIDLRWKRLSSLQSIDNHNQSVRENRATQCGCHIDFMTSSVAVNLRLCNGTDDFVLREQEHSPEVLRSLCHRYNVQVETQVFRNKENINHK